MSRHHYEDDDDTDPWVKLISFLVLAVIAVIVGAVWCCIWCCRRNRPPTGRIISGPPPPAPETDTLLPGDPRHQYYKGQAGSPYPTSEQTSPGIALYPVVPTTYPTNTPYPTANQPYPGINQPYPAAHQPYPTTNQSYPGADQPYPTDKPATIS